MIVHMYDHPAVKRNFQRLHDDGIRFIEPSEGFLACGYVGKGRLEEPEKITELVNGFFSREMLLSKKAPLGALIGKFGGSNGATDDARIGRVATHIGAMGDDDDLMVPRQRPECLSDDLARSAADTNVDLVKDQSRDGIRLGEDGLQG